MNRKNLTAAVLAGLAGVVGLMGSAQASLLSMSKLFATGPPASVETNVPDAAAHMLSVNQLNTIAILDIVEEEVPDLVGTIISSEEVQYICKIAWVDVGPDDVSEEGMSGEYFATSPIA